jgi:hypothetical protein
MIVLHSGRGGVAIMDEKRKIKASDIVADIRGGMTASQIATKYRKSKREIQLIFRKLLDWKAVSQTELHARQCFPATRVRRERRRRITFPLKVFDGANPFDSGLVRDVSQKGFCIEGLEVGVGDVKNFIIRYGNLLQGRSFVFEAQCQWVNDKGGGRDRKILAGLEITNISALDSKELRKLLP